jgi:signal transduction histidine kinase
MVRALAELLDRCRRLPPVVADAALAAIVAGVTVVTVVVESRNDDQPVGLYGAALLAAQFVPLVWRRRAPLEVAVVTGLCGAAYGLAELPDPPVVFAPLLALYTVAAYRPRRISVPFGLVAAAIVALVIPFGDSSDAADVAVSYFSGVTAWVVGDTTRGQRERARWLDERRADAARQAARDERIRIARDLHDVVAHHVSVIAVQAEAAQEVLASQPERASAAMGHVADTARSALTELRRVLGVLRSDAVLTPQPGLSAVDDLVASVRSAGVPVTLRWDGGDEGDGAAGPPPVDAVVGLTAYRIVQEALTNVLKHAGSCRAEVVVGLAAAGRALDVTITDDGCGSDTADGSDGADGDRDGEGGQGLAGMRERVAVLGGQFEAGPGPAGGFTVHARLPAAPAVPTVPEGVR